MIHEKVSGVSAYATESLKVSKCARMASTTHAYGQTMVPVARAKLDIYDCRKCKDVEVATLTTRGFVSLG